MWGGTIPLRIIYFVTIHEATSKWHFFPKLVLLLSQNFECSYLLQNKHFWSILGHFNLWLKTAIHHWKGLFKGYKNGFVVESQILDLIFGLSFHHTSFISSLNEQCKGILNIHTLKAFQWYHGDPIWCLFTLSTKVLNIQNFNTSGIPKMRVHLEVIGFHLLYSPPFMKGCFTLEHIFLASWAFALHT